MARKRTKATAPSAAATAAAATTASAAAASASTSAAAAGAGAGAGGTAARKTKRRIKRPSARGGGMRGHPKHPRKPPAGATTKRRPPPPNPFPTLPTSIFREILTLAAPECTPSSLFAFAEGSGIQRDDKDIVARAPLASLRLVARDWLALVDGHAGMRWRQRLTLRVRGITRGDVLDLRRELVLRGAYLRELTVQVDWTRVPDNAPRPDLAQIPWGSLLCHAPRLERLDLRVVGAPGAAEIINAAATHCPGLRELLLPQETRESTGPTPIVNAVLGGLRHWARGPGGGLRRLRVPADPSRDPHELATAVVEELVAWCPRLEAYEGYAETEQPDQRMLCPAPWYLDPVTWTRFCEASEELVEFHWAHVPYSTLFFEIFGRSPKPQLRRLTLGTAMDWDWDAYHRAIGPAHEAASRAGGFGATAQRVEALLQACPGLRELTITLFAPREADDEDDDDDDQSPPVPTDARIDQERFGDAFCLALVSACPDLEKLTISNIVETTRLQRTIMSLTDQGLGALGRLPRLRRLDLKATNISSRGLYALLSNTPGGFSWQQELQLSVGDAEGPMTMAFYRLLESFVTRLAGARERLPFAQRRVVLQVHNTNFAPASRPWSVKYLQRLRGQLLAAQKRHPGLQLRVVLTGWRDGGGFTEILEFGLFTAASTPNQWLGWNGDSLHGPPIDGVFVVRHGMNPYGVDEYDDDEYDDDEYDDDDDDFDPEYDDYGDYYGYGSDAYYDEDLGEFYDDDSDYGDFVPPYIPEDDFF